MSLTAHTSQEPTLDYSVVPGVVGNAEPALNVSETRVHEWAASDDGEAPMSSAGSLSIRKDILRAVPLHRSLACFGQYWRYCPADLPLNRREGLYGMSSPADSIDVFLSHTWRTAGWIKALCLFIRFGTRYYWFFGVLTLLTLFILQGCAVIPTIAEGEHLELGTYGWEGKWPESIWCTLWAPPSMILAVALWPMLPRCLQRDMFVFLDVLCISQVNEDLMMEGVYSLGGFMTKSKEMLILWDRHYLKRKWCVFELASFLAAPGERTILFAPLYMETSVGIAFVAVWMMATAFQVSKVCELNPMIALLASCSLLPVAMHTIRKHICEKHIFLQDLKTFDVDASSCREDFDAQYIETAIVAWWGTKQQFNNTVRTRVSEIVTRSASGTDMPYSYALLVSFPSLCLWLDRVSSAMTSDMPNQAILFLMLRTVGRVGIYPALVKLGFILCDKSTTGERQEGCCCSVFRSIAVSLPVAIGLGLEDWVCKIIIQRDYLVLLLPLAILQLFLAALVWQSSLARQLKVCWAKRQQGSEAVIAGPLGQGEDQMHVFEAMRKALHPPRRSSLDPQTPMH